MFTINLSCSFYIIVYNFFLCQMIHFEHLTKSCNYFRDTETKKKKNNKFYSRNFKCTTTTLRHLSNS